MAHSRPRDPVLEGGQNTDLVIPVMGPTKAGKSSFVNQLLGSHLCEVGGKLASCTSLVTGYVPPQPPDNLTTVLGGRRIVFVDTPGFDDTHIGDEEILSRISDWLTGSYRKGMHVSGVIYLHDISRDGFTESLSRNLTMMSKLCGEGAMDQVAIVTTKWDRLQDVKEGDGKVEELRKDFWSKILADGARDFRVQPPDNMAYFSAYHRDPWGIVRDLLLTANARDAQDVILQIQHEIVDRKLLLPQTEAGKELQMSLANLLKKAKDLRRRIKEDKRVGTESSARSLEMLEMRQEEISKIIDQLKTLKGPGLVSRARRLFQLFSNS